MYRKPLAMIAACAALACAATFASALGITGPDKQDVLPVVLRGVYFVPNQGQWSDADVYFGLRSRGLDVAFRESAFTMHVSRQTGSERCDRNDELTPNPDAMLTHGGDSPGDRADFEHLTLTVSFPGSNSVVPEGGKPQTARFNYFVGGEGRGMASDVPSFGAVVYHDLYDGVDLHVMGSDDGVLKYEFHIGPGADCGQIRIAYDGIDGLCIDERSGDLLIETPFGTLRDHAPIVWQTDPSLTLRARFTALDRRTYTITLENSGDPTLPLVIDPEIEWMYYLGGSRDDWGYDIAVDSSGNALVTGWTDSTDFADRNNSNYGGNDAFALKVSPAGQLQWMTYLGGSGSDWGYGIALDGAGNALVTGVTQSTDFAERNNSHYGGNDDVFALKISPSGQMLWMTYLGGSGSDSGDGIAVDGAGNVLVTGNTYSSDFAGRNNSHNGGLVDAFALKISPSGEMLWMTFLGGSRGDWGSNIVAEGAGDVLVSGATESVDFAARNNSHHGGDKDAFALKVSPSGQLEWMTYLGGSDWDSNGGMTLDSEGNALVTGGTESTDFTGRNNSLYGGLDAFALKVNPLGQLLWMTYLGGSRWDGAGGVTVDGADNALVTGQTESADFTGRNNPLYGSSDAFALNVSPAGQLQWMTYVGGSGFDLGSSIAVDSGGDVRMTGFTRSTDFAAHNNSYHGNRDAFILKLRLGDGPQLSVNASCPWGGPISVSWSGATGGETIALLFARNTGSFVVPNGRPCAGTALGLGTNQLQNVFQGSAGLEGSRTLNSNAGPSACGGYLQLLDLATCGTSNVARIE